MNSASGNVDGCRSQPSSSGRDEDGHSPLSDNQTKHEFDYSAMIGKRIRVLDVRAQFPRWLVGVLAKVTKETYPLEGVYFILHCIF